MGSSKVCREVTFDEPFGHGEGRSGTDGSCGKRDIDPIQQFRHEVRTNFHGDLKGPFNTADRAKAVSR